MVFGLVRRNARSASTGTEPGREGSPAERYRLATSFGENGTAFLGLYEGWEHFHPAAHEGFVAFERHNGVALALGEPVCAPGLEASTTVAFAEFCQKEGLVPAFAAATSRFAETARGAGWSAVKAGEEPIFATADYAPRGNRTKKVRSAANQARKSGVMVETIAAGERPSAVLSREMGEVLALWRESRNVRALGFALRLSPLAFARDKVILVARKEDRLEGFVTCIPYRGGTAYYIEDLIRRPDAANGVSELLFLQAVEECRMRGAEAVNLGLAPLRNCREQPGGRRLLGRALDFTFRRLNVFYKFKPLEHFKAKFGPTHWEELYLVYPPGQLPRVAVSLVSAFTPGKFGPAMTVMSRVRPRGRSTVTGARVAGGLAVAAIAAVVLHDPLLASGFAQHAIAAVELPVVEAEDVARAHVIFDAVAVAAGGAWLFRANRRQD